MSEIQRLLRVAARRNEAGEYTFAKFRVLRTLNEEFRRRAAEDRTSPNVIFEAFLRGYVNHHPAVLAMVDQWIRDEGMEPPEQKAPRLSKADLDEVYAAAASGMIADDDRCYSCHEPLGSMGLCDVCDDTTEE